MTCLLFSMSSLYLWHPGSTWHIRGRWCGPAPCRALGGGGGLGGHARQGWLDPKCHPAASFPRTLSIPRDPSACVPCHRAASFIQSHLCNDSIFMVLHVHPVQSQDALPFRRRGPCSSSRHRAFVFCGPTQLLTGRQVHLLMTPLQPWDSLLTAHHFSTAYSSFTCLSNVSGETEIGFGLHALLLGYFSDL